MAQDSVALRALAEGAILSISVSGGKDSQAMLRWLVALRDDSGWPGEADVVHADLGRAEWPQTSAHVERIAEEAGLPLVVVRRTKGDLVQRIEDRLNTVSTVDPSRPAKPFWPSAAQRYCTSDLKRDPIQRHTRTLGGGATKGAGEGAVVVSAQGMRASESPGRAKRPPLAVDRRLTSADLRDLDPAAALDAQARLGGRLVLNWLPIHGWSDEDIWRALGTDPLDLARRRSLYAAGETEKALTGWEAHPAYVFGNERLSCALCVLASRSDLINGARHNPDLARHYAELERRSSYTFRADLSIAEVLEEAGVTDA